MTDSHSKDVQDVLQGDGERVVSFSGRSQYSPNGGGVSACGLAALNSARLVLQKDREGVRGSKLLEEMMKQETFEEILGICTQWTSPAHLDVDDIYSAPIFAKSLTLMWSEYEQPGFKQFQDLLGRLQQSEAGSAALVITRPPEIVSVFKIATDATPAFVTFDSHPRQKHPDGAAFVFHSSLDATASYLSDLLQFDPALLADPTLQWQAQLLAHYSAHMFVAKEVPTSSTDLLDALMEASLDVLTLKAEISELNVRNRALESDNRVLTEENTLLEAKVEDLEEDVRRHIRRATFSETTGESKHATNSSISIPVLPPSSKIDIPHNNAFASSSKSVFELHTGEVQDDETFASLVQMEWQEQEEPGAKLAYERQREYEEEDRILRAQYETLKQEQPQRFTCGVCLEEEAEDMVANIDGCGHSFCRNCVLSYLRSKLTEHRYPIPCPVCVTEKSGFDPGIVSGTLAQIVGLTEEEYAVFTELELAAFSVPLHCRKCQQTAFVDRDEYDAQAVIVCPLPGCNYAWCKACSRAIEIGGPPHSCDGTAELNHLMSEQGWKHCPGCRTPTSKIEGCNHMTCISPSCNTHFCYLCGDTIIQSVRREDIRQALSNHYTRCRMIDDIVDTPRRRR